MWTEIAAVEGDDLGALRELGREYVGSQALVGSGTIVSFTDDKPFGETMVKRRVERLFVPAVTVEQSSGDARCVIDLNLVFDEGTRELLVGFTNARSEWVLPDGPPKDPEASVPVCTEVTPLGRNAIQSTVQDVLGVMWMRGGVDPSKAGQVILRPRMAMCGWPPTQVGEEMVLNTTAAPYWVIHAVGMVMPVLADPWLRYRSGYLLLLRDDDLDVFSARYLP
jgi:hypothetical protein